MDLPDPGTKLRLVLDYLPCEACLAQPVADQDLLCTICARLDRQVAVRVGTRTTILVERPSPPEAPIVIAPAAPAPPEDRRDDVATSEVPREIAVTLAGEESRAEPGSIEVVVEPLEALPPLVVLAPIAAPLPAPEPEEDFQFDDLVSFVPARDEFFDYRPGKRSTPAPEPEPAPAAVEFENEPAAVPEDDYVFRPPPVEEAPPPVREESAMVDDIIPTSEVPVEPERQEVERWAPPPDFLAEEAAEEEIFEAEVVEEDQPAPAPPPAEEEEILEMEVLPDEEEVVEMEVIPDDEPPAPAPTGSGDLYRLRGFDVGAESALAKSDIREVAHLAGHDAGELAQRSGIPFERLLPWIQVADLVQDVGVPFDAAQALVTAGVGGPRGLAEADPDEVVDRVAAFGGATLDARDVRRWKRRA